MTIANFRTESYFQWGTRSYKKEPHWIGRHGKKCHATGYIHRQLAANEHSAKDWWLNGECWEETKKNDGGRNFIAD
jgi:hypothetical protein